MIEAHRRSVVSICFDLLAPGMPRRHREGVWPFDGKLQTPILNVAVGGWAGAPDPRWTIQTALIEQVVVSQ
jgi:hypothetical protein